MPTNDLDFSGLGLSICRLFDSSEMTLIRTPRLQLAEDLSMHLASHRHFSTFFRRICTLGVPFRLQRLLKASQLCQLLCRLLRGCLRFPPCRSCVLLRFLRFVALPLLQTDHQGPSAARSPSRFIFQHIFPHETVGGSVPICPTRIPVPVVILKISASFYPIFFVFL